MSGPQVVPHSREAEEAVIGAVLINPPCLDTDVAFLRPEHFYIHRNGWIWEAFIRLHSQNIPIDFVTITEELDKMGHLADVGGAAYVTKMLNNVPSSLHAEAYGRRVEETYLRRKMLANANQEAKDAYDEEKPINEIVADAQTNWSSITQIKDFGRSLMAAISDHSDQVLERINMRSRGEKVEVGYKTGIGYIDRNFHGLKKGWMVAFCGKPKIGKSRTVTQLTNVISKQPEGNGCIISLEMDEESTTYRMLEIMTGIPSTDIELGLCEPEPIVKALGELEDKIHIWCPSELDIETLRTYIAKQKAERNIGWFVLDYMDLMTAPKARTETEEDKVLWNQMKTRVCKEFNVLGILLESVKKLAADGIMTDDKVIGSYGKIHACDIVFGYSPYPVEGIPHMGCPVIDDPNRRMKCRILNVMVDRHREQTGIVMPLELFTEGELKGIIYDLKKKGDDEREAPEWWNK